MKTIQRKSLESDIIIHIHFDAPDSHEIFLDENHAMALQNFLRSKKIQSSLEFHVQPDEENRFKTPKQFCMKISKSEDRSKLFAFVTDYLSENEIPFERDDHANTFVLYPS